MRYLTGQLESCEAAYGRLGQQHSAAMRGFEARCAGLQRQIQVCPMRIVHPKSFTVPVAGGTDNLLHERCILENMVIIKAQ